MFTKTTQSESHQVVRPKEADEQEKIRLASLREQAQVTRPQDTK